MLDPPVPVPRALTWATHIDVLPLDRELSRRGDCTVVHSPSNPTHWWGNLLLFDEPPAPGEMRSWERRFATEFATDTGVRHVTLAWDRTDGALGAANEFVVAGYALEETVALTAAPAALSHHPRAHREVHIRTLDPEPGADASAWEQAIALSAANSPELDRRAAAAFTERRLADLRELFRDGRGAWYVAQIGRRVVAACGVVVTAGRGRYQHVDTEAGERRRGIASRLVVAAGQHAAERYGAERLVICADPGYHALGLYESLGFAVAERTAGVCRRPSA
ncbi:MAG TPA: GNAT family N-acetyltransferase [Solirubrobacteraceae bacterium]|nr:GNAT family N-acetyltransferase [Solirubrobacteraceae bacterium]